MLQSEKRNPGLTSVDWCKFIVSAAIGLATVISSLQVPRADLRVIYAILSALVGYCIKTYLTFSEESHSVSEPNHAVRLRETARQRMGVLLHLCDDVIQQEVKGVIISFFILMQKGKPPVSKSTSSVRKLIKEEFGQKCNFDADDTIQKHDKLGILHRMLKTFLDAMGNYSNED